MAYSSIETLPAHLRDPLVEGLARGDYHLLLGAGASVDAADRHGKGLPTGRELTAELLKAFGLPEEDVSLQMAYEAVENQASGTGVTREQFLIDRFTQCDPSWHKAIADIRWNRIWTLNIDDVVEQAYASNSSPQQSPHPLSWRSLFRDPEIDKNEVQIVHLHGFARFLASDPPDTLVFSVVEYLQATSERHAWHRVFGDLFLQRPFVILGARLADEYDLGEVLRRGSYSTKYSGRPSFVVLREMSELQAKQFERWGLIPIELPAKGFFEQVHEDVRRVAAKLPTGAAATGEKTAIAPEAATFLQQFRRLSTDSIPAVPQAHDFYQGDDPLWTDILSDLDARFDAVESVLADLPRFPDPTRVNVYCFIGPRGCGKSTAMLRAAREMISRGMDIFQFRGEARMAVKSVLWWLKQQPKTVLLIEGITDVAEEVGEIARRQRAVGGALLVIATERDSRLPPVYRNISPEDLFSANMARLSDRDIDELVRKLATARRLGRITRSSNYARREHFQKDARRQLLVGMHGLEEGAGFVGRLRHEYSEGIKDDDHRRLYALICMSYSFGVPLPLGIAEAASGLRAVDIARAVEKDETIKAVIHAEERGLLPRHRVVASLVIEKALQREERGRLLQALARAIAPYVTSYSLTSRTVPGRIAQNIMDADVVCQWVGVAEASAWYDEAESSYAWNPRFWEQRALAEVKGRHYPKARSYAEEAVRIRKDTLTTNTLGAVLADMALEYFALGSPESERAFWEGIAALDQSRELGEDRFEYPFFTFFSRSLRYARKAYKGKIRDGRLLDEWHRWTVNAKRVEVFRHKEYQAQLEKFEHDWLSLTVGTLKT